MEPQAQVTSPPHDAGMSRHPWTTAAQAIPRQPACPLGQVVGVSLVRHVLDTRQRSAKEHSR